MYLFFLLLFETLLVIISYIVFRDILSPTFDMAVMFTFATVLMLPYVRVWRVNFSFETIFIIITGLYLVFLIEWIVSTMNKRFHPKLLFGNPKVSLLQEKKRISQSYQVLACLIQLVTLMLLWSEVKRIGGNWGETRNLYRLLNRYRIYTINGIDKVNFMTSQFMKISTAFGYCSVFWGIDGLVRHEKRGALKENFLFISSAILLIVQFLLNSTRGPIINYVVFGIVIFYVKYQQRHSWRVQANKRIIRIICVMAVFLFIVFSASRFLIGRDISETPIDNLARYFSGSLQLFDLYIKNPVSRGRYWGEETFTGIIQSLYRWGSENVETFISIALENRPVGNHTGNVYTIFRRPLHDFGYAGMYIFVSVVALIFSYTYYFKIKYRECTDKRDLELFYYGYFYHWIISSVVDSYSFNLATSTIVMVVMLAILFKVYSKIRIKFF